MPLIFQDQELQRGNQKDSLFGIENKTKAYNNLTEKYLAELQNVLGKYSKNWNAADVFSKILKTFQNYGAKDHSERAKASSIRTYGKADREAEICESGSNTRDFTPLSSRMTPKGATVKTYEKYLEYFGYYENYKARK